MNHPTTKTHVLLLGASGFIGNAVYHLLKAREDIELSILLRQPDAAIRQGHIYYGDLSSFDWLQIKHPPEVVLHLARISSMRWGKIGRQLAGWKGYFANKRLLSYLSQNEVFKKVIYVSGSLMYGNSNEPVTEAARLSPLSFAREYIRAEQPLLKMLQAQDDQVCLLRVPWVLGQGSWFQTFYLDYISSNDHVPQYGKGDNLMAFIALSDLARCIEALCAEPFSGLLHAVAAEYSSQVNFCALLSLMLGKPIRHLSLAHHEAAVQEAFTSNIPLVSQYDVLQPYIRFNTLREILQQELPFFKDI